MTMQYPDIIKITGDYGIRKPIYISTVHALKHISGQCLMEKLKPGLYHRSKVRDWLWKNQSKAFVEVKPLLKASAKAKNVVHLPVVHMTNYIRRYSMLYNAIVNALQYFVNDEIKSKFFKRYNDIEANFKHAPFYFNVESTIPRYSLEQATSQDYDSRKFTNTDIIRLQKKINDVIANHKFSKLEKAVDVRDTSAKRLVYKWYGVKEGNYDKALKGTRIQMFNYTSK